MATKMYKTPFRPSTRRATKPLELVHTDVAGPMRVPSAVHGHFYVINFVDDYSQHTKIYMMKNKSEALNKFKQYIADVGPPQTLSAGITTNNQHENKAIPNSKVKSLRSDNGGEYTSKLFERFCSENQIKREFTIARTPEQNGVAERTWRTLFDMARTMLKEANLDQKWWARAVITAIYIKKRILSSSIQKKATAFKLFTGKKPDISVEKSSVIIKKMSKPIG